MPTIRTSRWWYFFAAAIVLLNTVLLVSSHRFNERRLNELETQMKSMMEMIERQDSERKSNDGPRVVPLSSARMTSGQQ